MRPVTCPDASTVPLPGDGFAAAIGLEPASRYDVAEQMGLDSFSADTGGAAAAVFDSGISVDGDGIETSGWASGSVAAPAEGDSRAAVPHWAGGQRQLQQAAGASSCIGATFTVVSVRRSLLSSSISPHQHSL